MRTITIAFIILLTAGLRSQDTFSIVAIDTITGEIGSAGASCIDESAIAGGALIISDIIPGRGAIHTQSYWHPTNQQNAHNRMVEGMSPQQIIDWLVENDVQNLPGRRQYGIVDHDGNGSPRSAAFTGAQCLDYKNHITGPNYAIQGNILLGQQILDSMEARFLNTDGMLAEKLMAALQGANVPGADTRCMANGTSSLSAFIRVARATDTIGNFYCDLNVPSVPYGMEPIDSLQILFDAWLGTVVGLKENDKLFDISVYPNPAVTYLTVRGQQLTAEGKIAIYNHFGQRLEQFALPEEEHWSLRIDIGHYPAGIYLLRLESREQVIMARKVVVSRMGR